MSYMLQKLAIRTLLVPMLLNGFWVVCSDPSSSSTAGATDTRARLEENADCIKMCLMKHQVDLGAICFVLPGDTKTSITIFDFGFAILPLEFKLHPIAAEELLVTSLSAVYSNPSLSIHTPPPEA